MSNPEHAVIVWRDATSAGSDGAWKSRHELPTGLAVCVSSGWVYDETDDHVQLVAHIAGIGEPDPSFGGDICIPKAWIVKDKRTRPQLGCKFSVGKE